MAKKSKYDTDPLDPNVADRADQAWGSNASPATAPIGPEYQPAAAAPKGPGYAEDPTRRLDQKGYTAYQSVYEATVAQPPTDAPLSKAADKKIIQPPTKRIVPGIKLAENLTLILPYMPFYIGAVIAIIELYLVPRSETRVRFHAAQGLALHIVAIAISTVLGFLSNFNGAKVGGIVFSIAATILFIVSMVRVWRGEPNHIAPVDDLSTWLNDKINPKK